MASGDNIINPINISLKAGSITRSFQIFANKMRVVVVLCALLAVALAGPSPNADVIESLLRDEAWASKFSTNVIADALLDVVSQYFCIVNLN